MLPEIKLDDETYQEIMQQVRSRIALYYPEWTDYNLHDPGITFLELFAWLKEAQQYYIDHLDSEIRPKFLQLLGMHMLHRQPAQGMIALCTKEQMEFAENTPFYAEKMCLTLQEHVWNSGVCLKQMQSADSTVCRCEGFCTKQLHFYPFSEKPEKNSCWTLLFEEAVPSVPVLALYVRIFEEYPVKRTPFQEDFPRLTEWTAEAETETGWKSCSIIQDDTAALTISGRICLALPQAKKIRALRFRLSSVSYDVPPLLTAIWTDVFPVKQAEAKACCIRIQAKEQKTVWQVPLTYPVEQWHNNCFLKHGDGWISAAPVQKKQGVDVISLHFVQQASELLLVCTQPEAKEYLVLGTGDGFPEQEFHIRYEDLAYDDFMLMIYDSYEKCWYLWEKTESLLKASHTDRYYFLDAEKGVVRFGDGIHGRMPDGEIRIISLSITEAEKGNLLGGSLTASPVLKDVPKLAQYAALQGGCASETPVECFQRQSEAQLPARAVTEQDYERLIYAAPGLMIQSCHVWAGPVGQNSVNIVFEPYTGQEKAPENPVYLKILEQYLSPFRLVGTQLSVSYPKYAEIELYAEIQTRSCEEECRKAIEMQLKRLFHVSYHQFGRSILYSAVYAALDSLPEIVQVIHLSMQCHSQGVRISRNGDFFLPENCLPYLSQAELKLTLR